MSHIHHWLNTTNLLLALKFLVWTVKQYSSRPSGPWRHDILFLSRPTFLPFDFDLSMHYRPQVYLFPDRSSSQNNLDSWIWCYLSSPLFHQFFLYHFAIIWGWVETSLVRPILSHYVVLWMCIYKTPLIWSDLVYFSFICTLFMLKSPFYGEINILSFYIKINSTCEYCTCNSHLCEMRV